MQRWYERFGIQVNHPPKDRVPERYERPSIWRRQVAPPRLRLPVSVGTFAIVVGLLTAAGLSFSQAFSFGPISAIAAQFILDSWWRRNRPPSEDHVSTLFSKDPDDYR
jgi:hypothetical protein